MPELSDEVSIQIILPPISDDQVSNDLVWLTEHCAKAGADISGGFLGGEFGYGAYVDNDVFMMHPFCWCEQDDCPWCWGCECPDGATRYFMFGSEVTAEHFFDNGGYTAGTSEPVPELECAYCKGEKPSAPNFHHKASGTRIGWYKYIGRGMEVDLRGDWRTILQECAASVADA